MLGHKARDIEDAEKQAHILADSVAVLKARDRMPGSQKESLETERKVGASLYG